LADRRSDVKRVIVAGIKETVHSLQSDVVGVDAKGPGPTEFAHGRFGRSTHAAGLGTNYNVLAIGLVADGHDRQARWRSRHARAQLCLRLMSKTVVYSVRNTLPGLNVATAEPVSFSSLATASGMDTAGAVDPAFYRIQCCFI